MRCLATVLKISFFSQVENSKFCRPDILKKLSEAVENAQVGTVLCVHACVCVCVCVCVCACMCVHVHVEVVQGPTLCVP